MLTVRLLPNTSKSMTLHNALETFTLGCSNHINTFAFSENLTCDGFTQVLIE